MFFSSTSARNTSIALKQASGRLGDERTSANSLGANGLVAYASPAFYKRSELWTHIEQRTLIVNTHFAPAIRVSGHGRYTYVDATTPGKAHSRIAEVPPLAFLNGGGRGGPPEGPSGGADGRTPQQLLKEARRAAKAALTTSPQLVGTAELFASAVQRATTFLGALGFQPDEPVQDVAYVATFSAMSGIGWAVV